LFFLRSFFLFSFCLSSSCALLCTFISESDCIQLKSFCKGSIQSNPKTFLSRLIHSLHYSSAVFPYQQLERKKVRGFNTMCGAAYQNSKATNTRSLYSVYNTEQYYSIALADWLGTCAVTLPTQILGILKPAKEMISRKGVST
jgi:hypothetical protein